jgi:hypothetical protein
MSIWKELIETIDSLYRCGLSKLTRKSLIKYFYPGRKWNQLPWTIDNYRRYLTKAGYLSTIKPGVYEILKSPAGKTLFKVKFEAYPASMICEILRKQKRLKELFDFKDKINMINNCEYHVENLADHYKSKNKFSVYVKNWTEYLRNNEINKMKDCIGINI